MTLHAALNLYRLSLLSLAKEINSGRLTKHVADKFALRQYNYLRMQLKTDRKTFDYVCIKLERKYYNLTA